MQEYERQLNQMDTLQTIPQQSTTGSGGPTRTSKNPYDTLDRELINQAELVLSMLRVDVDEEASEKVLSEFFGDLPPAPPTTPTAHRGTATASSRPPFIVDNNSLPFDADVDNGRAQPSVPAYNGTSSASRSDLNNQRDKGKEKVAAAGGWQKATTGTNTESNADREQALQYLETLLNLQGPPPPVPTTATRPNRSNSSLRRAYSTDQLRTYQDYEAMKGRVEEQKARYLEDDTYLNESLVIDLTLGKCC